MAQVAMSLTEAFGLTERFGPPVDPLTRRMFLERDLRNGYLPKSPRPEAAEWRKVWRMTATVHSQDGSEVLKKNDILPPGTKNPWHLMLIADSFGSPFPKVEPVWVLVERIPAPADVSLTEYGTAPKSTGPGRKEGSKRIPPPADIFKARFEGIIQRLRLALKDKDEVSPQDVWEDEEWRKWQNCSSSSSFYRRLGEHDINFPAFLRSLPWPKSLSQ